MGIPLSVTRYFLLCGYTPFDRDSQYEEMQAIVRGDYKFEPVRPSTFASHAQRLTPVTLAERVLARRLRASPGVCPKMPHHRSYKPTAAEELLQDPWLKNVEEHYVATPQGSATDLLPQVKKAFDARKTCTSGLHYSHSLYGTDHALVNFVVRKAVLGMMAMHRLQDTLGQSASAKAEQEEKIKLRGEVDQYKREAEAVSLLRDSADTHGAIVLLLK